MAGIRLPALPLVLFKIYDTLSCEFWETNQGKLIWTKLNHAKTAWTSQSWHEGDVRFNDQERYKIVKFTVPEWDNAVFNFWET